MKTCQWKKWDCCLHYLSSSCLVFLYFLITAKREEGFICFQYCYWLLSAIISRFFSGTSCPFGVHWSLLLILQVMWPLSYFPMLLKYNCKSLSSLVIALLTYLPEMLICWCSCVITVYKKCLYMVISYTGLVCLLIFTSNTCQLWKSYRVLL